MAPGTIRPLTARQRAVMERIDRRIPIKVIALELGVSETRINQHIRALKDIYGAASLFALVENYRIAEGRAGDDVPVGSEPVAEPYELLADPPLSEPAYSKKQVLQTYPIPNDWPRDDAGKLVVGDIMPLADEASSQMLSQAGWFPATEPRVVPGLLEGEHAVPLRLLAMILIAAGILAAVVLTVTAAMALSEAMAGKADLPMEQWTGAV